MSLNTVVLMGRLASDPELRMTTSGNEVVNFRIAVDRPFSKDKNAQTSDFFTVIAWNSTATFVSKYFKKGSPIAIQGRLQTRRYEDGNGNKKTAVEVVAGEVSFCGSKNEGTAPAKPKATEEADGFSTAASSDFEEIGDDEDMPF